MQLLLTILMDSGSSSGSTVIELGMLMICRYGWTEISDENLR